MSMEVKTLAELNAKYTEFVSNSHKWFRINVPDFDFFVRFYTEPHRYYHNFHHVIDMLNNLKTFGGFMTKPEEVLVEAGIWWHDIIYDPHRDDNEKTSLLLFNVSTLHTSVQQSHCTYRLAVREMIRASTHFESRISTSPYVDFFLDLDLAGLGYPEKLFKENSENIRQEFKHLPDPIFYCSRYTFLQRLINRRPNIYNNPYKFSYFDILEKQAKENIHKEMDRINDYMKTGGNEQTSRDQG